MAQWRRAAVTALIVGVVLACLVGCGGADARRSRHMQRGQEYLEQGNLAKAQIEFRNAMQIAPADIDARLMAGQVASKLGNLRDAVALYQSAIDLQSTNVRARVELGRLYVFARVPERALELVRPALELHPDDVELLTLRGSAYAEKKDQALARADAERAVALAPDNESAVGLLATVDAADHQYQHAVDLLLHTLTRLPDSIALRQILAGLYTQLDQLPLAEDQLAEIVRRRPGDLSYRYQLVLAYTHARQFDRAERALKDAVDALPDKDEPKLAYAQFVATHNSVGAAEQVLDAFIRRAPDDLDLQLALGRLQQVSGDGTRALSTYQRIAAAAPSGRQAIEARDRSAQLLAAQQRFTEAQKLIAEVLQRNPRDNDALLLRARIAIVQRDPAAAIADVRAVLRDQPRSATALRILAQAHIANDEPALAEESFHSAIEIAPKDLSLRAELAELLIEEHRVDAAISVIQDAQRAAPDDPALGGALVRAYLGKPDLEAARAQAERLKSSASGSALPFYLAGLVAQAQKRPQDAVREYERALVLQPSAVDTLAALARLYVAEGRTDEAIRRVASVTATQPANAAAQNMLGELYWSARHIPESIAAFKRATQLAPKWWLPYRSLALAQAATGDRAAAIRTCEQAESAVGWHAAIVADLANLYEQAARVDDAIRQYEMLLREDSRSQLASNNLAMLLVTYKKDRASLDRARELTARFAGSTDARLIDTDGWVQFKRGELAQALPLLERAAEIAPSSNVISYHLGMAQLRAGQSDRARSSLERAINASQPFSGIEEARAALTQLTPRPDRARADAPHARS